MIRRVDPRAKGMVNNVYGTPVPLDFEVELSGGHELVFLPLVPDWHNATTTLEGLSLERVR